MGKNTIQLNESQLRQIVAESVKKILSELDWKTYANAAKKAESMGDPRASTFQQAAKKEFDRAYGYSGEDETEYGKYNPENFVGIRRDLSGLHAHENDSGRMFGGNSVHTNYQVADKHYDALGSTRTPMGVDLEYTGDDAWRALSNPTVRDAYLGAKQEYDKYAQGRYHYHPQRGWVALG